MVSKITEDKGKIVLYIMCIIFIFILSVQTALSFKVVYEDFEVDAFNTSKWTVTSSPSLSNFYYEGSKSAMLDAVGEYLDTKDGLLLPFNSSVVISLYLYYNGTSINDDVVIYFEKRDGTDCMKLDAGYPSISLWGYKNSADNWINSGTSSISGDGNIAKTWANMRIYLSATNNTWHVSFDGGLTTNFSSVMIGGCTVAQVDHLRLDASGTVRTFFDYIEVWDYATYGFSGKSLSTNILSPENKSIFNTNFLTINTSTNNDYDNFNISLFVNGVLNQTVFHNQTGSNILTSFNLTFSNTENTTYTYFFRTFNSEKTSDSATRYFIIDNVFPQITFFSPSSLNTTVLKNGFVTNIELLDPNLYSYHFYINSSSNTNIYSYYNNSLTGLYNYTVSLNVSLNNTGTMTMSVLTCDGHTNKQIASWKGTGIKKNKLNFDYYNTDVNIFLKDDSNLKKYQYEKKTDRYSFAIETKIKKSEVTIIIESKEYINILHGKTKYQGHLITGNKWIDFEGSNTKNVLIKRINDYSVEVTVTGNKEVLLWDFESIGELNCLFSSADFLLLNETQDYNLQTIVGSSELFTLSLNYNSSFYLHSPTAWLFYNGTRYETTTSLSDGKFTFSKTITVPNIAKNDNITFNWVYYFNNVNYTLSQEQQETFDFYLDDCTIYTTQTMNYTFINEITGASLYANITGNIIYRKSTIEKTLLLDSKNILNLTICMFPAFANLTSDIMLFYGSGGYGSRQYLATNYITDNITDYIQLSMLESGIGSDVTLHVVDSADNNIEDILIVVYRYDAGTNSDILINSKYTDSQGLSLFSLILSTEYYSFKFYIDGELVKSTSRFQLSTNSYQYIISTSDTNLLYEKYIIQKDLSTALFFQNSSNTFYFYWNYTGTNINTMCLKVLQADESFSDYCTAPSTSGVIATTILLLNTTYTAQSYYITNTGRVHYLESVFIDLRKSLFSMLGKINSVFFSIFMILIVVGVSLTSRNVYIILGGLATTILFFAYIGLLPISLQLATVFATFFIVIMIIIRRLT